MDDQTKNLAELIAQNFKDGQTLSHAWIRESLGLQEPDFSGVELIEESRRTSFISETLRKFQFAYMEAVDDLRECLLVNHQIALKNIRGEGYLIVPPGEQTALAMNQLRKDVARDIRKANDFLIHVRIDALALSERQENTDALAKLAFFSDLSKKRLLE